MKLLYPLFLALFLLSACGQGEAAPEGSVSPAPVTATPASTPIPTPSGEPEVPADETLPLSLSQEEAEAARQAALDYYAGTVFQVRSLVPRENPREGEITFQVSCHKGGEEQPERSVSLERQEGIWTVINEGY